MNETQSSLFPRWKTSVMSHHTQNKITLLLQPQTGPGWPDSAYLSKTQFLITLPYLSLLAALVFLFSTSPGSFSPRGLYTPSCFCGNVCSCSSPGHSPESFRSFPHVLAEHGLLLGSMSHSAQPGQSPPPPESLGGSLSTHLTLPAVPRLIYLGG